MKQHEITTWALIDRCTICIARTPLCLTLSQHSVEDLSQMSVNNMFALSSLQNTALILIFKRKSHVVLKRLQISEYTPAANTKKTQLPNSDPDS